MARMEVACNLKTCANFLKFSLCVLQTVATFERMDGLFFRRAVLSVRVFLADAHNALIASLRGRELAYHVIILNESESKKIQVIEIF